MSLATAGWLALMRTAFWRDSVRSAATLSTRPSPFTEAASSNAQGTQAMKLFEIEIGRSYKCDRKDGQCVATVKEKQDGSMHWGGSA